MATIRELLQAAAKRSTVIEGNEKIQTKDIIAKYPDGFVVDDFDMVTTSLSGKSYVCHIAGTKHYFYAGKILNTYLDSVVASLGGSLEDAQKMMRSDPVRMRFTDAYSTKGQRYTLVDIF